VIKLSAFDSDILLNTFQLFIP